MQYIRGKANFRYNSHSVSGIGTAWESNLEAGDYIMKENDTTLYKISSVDSETQLTLNIEFAGATASNVNYIALKDFTSNIGLYEVDISDTNWPTVFSTLTVDKLDNYFGAAIQHCKSQLIEMVHKIVTAEANIMALWVFDPVTGTVVTDRGTLAHDLTLSADAATLSPGRRGICPYVTLSSSAYFTHADDAHFTFGDASNDSAFTIFALIKPLELTSGTIFAKYDVTTAAVKVEYSFGFDANDKIFFKCFDAAAANFIGRTYSTALTDTGEWHSYIATKSTSALSSGITIWRDGVVIDNADSEGGSYTAMHDTAAAVGNYEIDASGDEVLIGSFCPGVIMIIKEALTTEQIKRIDWLLRSYVGYNI